jgi:hypothetical protein
VSTSALEMLSRLACTSAFVVLGVVAQHLIMASAQGIPLGSGLAKRLWERWDCQNRPMVAGPGAISTVIIDAQQASIWFDRVFLVLASLLVVVRLTAIRRRWP